MEEKIEDYLLWKSHYALPAAKSYRSPLMKIRKLDTLTDVYEFKRDIESKCAPSTVAYSMVILRDFVKYLNAMGLVKDKTLKPDLIKIPRFYYKRRTVATIDDVEKMMGVLDPQKFTELRSRVIIQLLADTGMRVSELVNLNLSDLEGKMALIKTKKQIGKGGLCGVKKPDMN